MQVISSNLAIITNLVRLEWETFMDQAIRKIKLEEVSLLKLDSSITFSITLLQYMVPIIRHRQILRLDINTDQELEIPQLLEVAVLLFLQEAFNLLERYSLEELLVIYLLIQAGEDLVVTYTSSKLLTTLNQVKIFRTEMSIFKQFKQMEDMV
jgi:hypothetical protein